MQKKVGRNRKRSTHMLKDAQKSLRCCVERLENRQLLAADPYFDLLTSTKNSSPGNFTSFNGKVLFAATGSLGNELYVTDGTPAGTHLVKDIQAGTGNSSPRSFVVIGDSAYFLASQTGTGSELWKTDGTAAGTAMVIDLKPGSGSSNISSMVSFRNQLYFFGTSNLNPALYRSDGTAATTSVVFSSVVSNPSGQNKMAIDSGRLYFDGSDPGGGVELHAVQPDGSVTLVADLLAGSASSNPIYLTPSGNGLYFVANTSTAGDVWKVDPTTGSAQLAMSLPTNPNEATTIIVGANNGRVFFSQLISSSTPSGPVYSNTGTPESTVTLPVNGSPLLSQPSFSYAGGLIFSGYDSVNSEPWFSDGTPGNTFKLAGSNAGSAGYGPQGFKLFNSRLYYLASNGSQSKIYVTDGTTAGTHLSTDPYGFDAALLPNGMVVSSYSDDDAGVEPAAFSPVNPTPSLLADLNSTAITMTPAGFVSAGPYVYLGINTVLWRTDGSANGTIPLATGYAKGLAGTNGKFYYAVGSEFYVTDGTVAGTSHLTTLSGTPTLIEQVGDQFFFVVLENGNHYKLTVASAAEPSTAVVVQDLDSVATSVSMIRAPGGRVIISMKNRDFLRIWTSDGTSDGTSVLLDVGTSSATATPLVTTSTAAYLYLTGGVNFNEVIYRTDGTLEGSYFLPTSATNGLNGATIYNDQLVYLAKGHLYSSDGTANGTVNFADIPDTHSLNGIGILRAAVMDGILYFIAGNGIDSSAGLWRTDGTANGTALITTLPAVAYGVNSTTAPQVIRVAGHRLYIDGNRGVFVSDGTAAGTSFISTVSSTDFRTNSAALDDAVITITQSDRYPLVRLSTDQRATITGSLFRDFDGDGAMDGDEFSMPVRRAFIDLNNNGVLDVDEPSQLTDGDGHFRFGGLVAGAYRIRQALPAGWISTAPLVETNLTAGQSVSVNLGSRLPGDSTTPLIIQNQLRLDVAPAALQLLLSESIGAVDAPQISIVNAATNQVTQIAPAQISINNDLNRVDINISSLNLADGNYNLVGLSGAITDLGGHTLGSGFSIPFFVFAGDANHNRTVDVDDLYVLASNWLGSGKTFAQGDFNFDGVVDGKDLGILSVRWQQTLAPPPPPAPPLPALATRTTTTRAASRTAISLVT